MTPEEFLARYEIANPPQKSRADDGAYPTGANNWELIVADDSGFLVYKKSISTPKYTYKVVQPPTLVQLPSLEGFLQSFGTGGWELVAISVPSNVVIFKQSQ